MNAMLEQILQTVQTMDQRMENVKNDVRGLKENVSGLKQEVSGLKQDVQGLKKGQESIPAIQRATFETNDPVRRPARQNLIFSPTVIEECALNIFVCASCFVHLPRPDWHCASMEASRLFPLVPQSSC